VNRVEWPIGIEKLNKVVWLAMRSFDEKVCPQRIKIFPIKRIEIIEGMA
jgi:hypothetical protein